MDGFSRGRPGYPAEGRPTERRPSDGRPTEGRPRADKGPKPKKAPRALRPNERRNSSYPAAYLLSRAAAQSSSQPVTLSPSCSNTRSPSYPAAQAHPPRIARVCPCLRVHLAEYLCAGMLSCVANGETIEISLLTVFLETVSIRFWISSMAMRLAAPGAQKVLRRYKSMVLTVRRVETYQGQGTRTEAVLGVFSVRICALRQRMAS